MKDTRPKISIVVPFRNIQSEIAREDSAFYLFLESLKSVSEFVEEVILVNDHSRDNSIEQVSSLKEANWKVLSLNSLSNGKKAALELGILEARSEYIWTLDSDVQIIDFDPMRFSEFMKNLKEDIVILPVRMSWGSTLLETLQGIEWRYMQFLTWASARLRMPMMCNGANLIFKRSVFLDAIDFHRSISSGDDHFLLSQVLKSNGEIGVQWKGFAVISILPENTLLGAVSQRIRWAGKTVKLPRTRASILHFFFGLMSVVHIFAFFGIFVNSLKDFSAAFLLIKLNLEVLGVLFVFSNRLKVLDVLVLIPQLLFYPFFSLAIFISSLFFVPKWKERRVSLK